jgi:hypothetical protein
VSAVSDGTGAADRYFGLDRPPEVHRFMLRRTTASNAVARVRSKPDLIRACIRHAGCPL